MSGDDRNEPEAGRPPEPPGPAGRIDRAQELLLLASICLLFTACDQWSKGWAVERLGPLHRDYSGRLRPPPDKEPVEVIDGALRFSITGNEGAIWGIGRDLSNTYKRPIFISLSTLAILFILLLMRGSRPEQRLRRIGLACVLSGALGNMLDRIRHDAVVDFIDWYWGYDWPTFNVADVAITVGVLLVIIDLYWHPDPGDEDVGEIEADPALAPEPEDDEDEREEDEDEEADAAEPGELAPAKS